MAKSKPHDKTDKKDQPHIYRAYQAREIIENAGNSRFIFWYEITYVPFAAIADYVLWHTTSREDAQHIIFTHCGITSVGQLEDQYLPWKKPSKPQRKWDKLYAGYTKWFESAK